MRAVIKRFWMMPTLIAVATGAALFTGCAAVSDRYFESNAKVVYFEDVPFDSMAPAVIKASENLGISISQTQATETMAAFEGSTLRIRYEKMLGNKKIKMYLKSDNTAGNLQEEKIFVNELTQILEPKK